jgi:formate-nitrite transporter family protein
MTRTAGRGDDGLGEHEAADIADRAETVGGQRLDRSNLDILVTSIIGGGEISIGSLAAMAVLGATLAAAPGINLYAALALAALVFPIGFIFVIVGRSELFTENFLIPVVAVFKTERTPRSLLELWGISWLGNLLGCAGTAALLLAPDALGGPIKNGYAAYTANKLDIPVPGVFISAVLAGGVMTALTWLLLSIEDTVGRLLAICAGAYVLMAANLSHSIVSASLLFVGLAGTSRGPADVISYLVVATAGNLLGGVGLVTLFRLAQADQQR